MSQTAGGFCGSFLPSWELKSEVSFGDPKSGDFENLVRILSTFSSVSDGLRLVIDRKCDFLRLYTL